MSLFQSNSIGVSSHKNEYKSGVRVGNWVEELFGAEAEAGGGDSLKVRISTASQLCRAVLLTARSCHACAGVHGRSGAGADRRVVDDGEGGAG